MALAFSKRPLKSQLLGLIINEIKNYSNEELEVLCIKLMEELEIREYMKRMDLEEDIKIINNLIIDP